MGLRRKCCGIALGTNYSPLPSLPSDGTSAILSTVTITVHEPTDTVRLMASIWSQTSSSTVLTSPLRGNTVQYLIVRTSNNATIRNVLDTDFDEMTTTFTAFDQPGVGTYTYNLVGSISRSTAPAQNEVVLSVNFTAEELNVV
ncbi:hypothetical protein [Bacillus sp. FJAT-50079]|uniref:hypothetical protein n=1 Tax=Bacillus sp. FJAT-50079 TaxID=2833577 RepID=UPI001BCA2376|nr:hypothetical protein [Bacillus sp. FJAT-50079]MBS4207358.1 hypothetical protein [Bacillus sp. FJAT-50079]